MTMINAIPAYFLAFTAILLLIYFLQQNRKQKKDLKVLSDKIYRLKTEQHDFRHHLQLLLTLHQMGKYDEALDYLNDLVDEIQQDRIVTYSGLPALDGLLHYKKGLAADNDIKLDIDISASLQQLPLPRPSLCKIIGNLLDNGIEYLKKINPEKRNLQLKIVQKHSSIQIITSNPVKGDISLPGGVERLLEPGFSSKGQERGLGLAIVNQLVHEAGGEVEAKLDKTREMISFIITLPREVTRTRSQSGRTLNN